ncbi:MAG: TetR/AcrR family transcriptional regulator [Mycobacteriaceae bacterium]
MVLQARAEATRRRIIDSAVELFDELGYGETGLADVLQHAGVSKGAFYYHFDSKEAVATAIIDEYRRRVKEAVHERTDPSAPALENIILATFTSAATIEADKTVRIGNQLLQALGQVSSVASQVYREWTETFVKGLATAIEAVGLRDGVDAVEAAEAMWAGVLGCHLLSSAIGDDSHARLARAWRAMLRATVPEHLLEHYYAVLDRATAAYQSVG